MLLHIAIPSNRDHSPHFVLHLIALNQRLTRHGAGVEGFDFKTKFKIGCSNLPQARQDFLDEAREEGATHLLFLDDDMTFPITMVETFLSRGVPVIGANCCRKSTDALYYTGVGFDGNPVESKGKAGIAEVAQVGTGILMIDMKAIDDVEPPHFSVPWLPDRQRYCSEDLFFCHRLREAGVKIYVDHDVSNEVGHVGPHVFRFDSYREAV